MHSADAILVIGSGGREHALVWKLSQSDKVAHIFVLPGSYEINLLPKVSVVEGLQGGGKDFEAVAMWCVANEIKLVVVGPEDPLADGIADVLVSHGLQCFGPSKAGALIEADKSWSKSFMKAWGIPTARYESFSNVDKAKAFIRSAPYDALVVKASGLAAGKGVVVAETREDACKAVDMILGDKKYGSAGSTIVVEEKLTGEEISLLAFVDGTTVKVMLPAQDHKRLGNDDSGPNTGGMGAYCPCPLIGDAALTDATVNILERAVKGFQSSNITYRGVLYAGLMLTPTGPKALEFNCRFGDPETQVILPLLDSDLYAIMKACCEGRLADVDIKWKTGQSAVGVVMASAGYPETSTKGCEITGLTKSTSDRIIFHSGTDFKDGKYVTNGGRVLINVALGSNLKVAADEATKGVEAIRFSGAGAQYRTDIAQKAFKPVQLSYKDAGVDICAGDALVQRIKPLAQGTHRPGVIGGLGGFGGLFRINELTYLNRAGTRAPYLDPVLVEKTSGIGEKLKIAIACGHYESIGIDLVAMCVNDVLCTGAQPIAFLDYIACGKLDVPLVAQIVKGIADGCREAKCALLGGETAEMPALFAKGSYDLAGYSVGVLDYGQEVGAPLAEGDLVIGLPASGLHCAGFNHVYEVMARLGATYDNVAPFDSNGRTFGQEFLTPSTIYVEQVLPLLYKGVVKAAVHVTNDGLLNNVEKILLGQPLIAELQATAWTMPPVYGWLLNQGGLSDLTILQSFNCGIGMVLVVGKEDRSWTTIPGALQIGKICRNNGNKQTVTIRNFTEVLRQVGAKFGGAPAERSVGAEKVEPIAAIVEGLITSTHSSRVYRKSGAFGKRMLRLYPDGRATYKDPILVIGTDGIGSKILIAKLIRKYETIGVDLVAMCVNDILCNGAEPLTFLDYYACGRIDRAVSRNIIAGVVDGVTQSDSALIDGKTVEMPVLYEEGEFDLAGFALGIVEGSRILPRVKDVQPGDIVIGLPSHGVHSNGFSLVHRVMQVGGLKFTDTATFSACGKTYGEELLVPTKIYTSAVKPLLREGNIKAIAHITGGGLLENIPRVLSDQLAIRLDFEHVNLQPVFGWLAATGNISDTEMQRTYNCGIGLCLIVSPLHAAHVLESLTHHGATIIGSVTSRPSPNHPQVQIDPTTFSTSMQRVQSLLTTRKKRVAVLISGTGSNLQALIDATRDTTMGIGAEIVFVISNKPDVMGLARATAAGIPSICLNHKHYSTREEFDAAMTTELRRHSVDIVCLAGFMRILSPEFVRQWRGRLLNIHPSLLPLHPGLHVQRKALEAGDKVTGCTVHFVDEGVDTGRIIIQRSVAIEVGETEETLTNKIHVAEHFAYPAALRMVATGVVKM